MFNFVNYFFNLKSSTPNHMIYEELGRVPLIVHIKTRIIALVNNYSWKTVKILLHNV